MRTWPRSLCSPERCCSHSAQVMSGQVGHSVVLYHALLEAMCQDCMCAVSALECDPVPWSLKIGEGGGSN